MPTPSRNWREIPQRYRFEAGKCKNCGYIAFPPRVICPRCRSREFETVVLPDRGKLLSHTIIRVPPQPFADQAPYAMGIIDLENGLRVTAKSWISNLTSYEPAFPSASSSGRFIRKEKRA